MIVDLEVGDRVEYTPFGIGAQNMVGTIMKISIEDDGSETYDVLWDGLDWMTEGWRLDQLEEQLPF